MAPKMQMTAQLPANINPQMEWPVRLETISEIKSVPAVEAPPLRASAMERP